MSELKKVATRAGFGEEILKLGKENPDILVIDADIGKSCKTGDFRRNYLQSIMTIRISM